MPRIFSNDFENETQSIYCREDRMFLAGLHDIVTCELTLH